MCLSSPTTHPLTPSHRLCPLGTISYHFRPLADSLIFTGRDNSSELKRRIPVVSLGQGKWPDDFVDAFKPPTPSRAININRRDLEKPIRSIPPHSVSPRKCAYIGESPPSGSVESLSHLGPRRPVHRPRHSLDAPVRPKEAVYGGGRADSAQQFHKQTWIVAFFN